MSGFQEDDENRRILPQMAVDVKPGEKIFKDYILKRKIGEGGFGRVYLVKNSIGQSFALKILFRGVEGEERGINSVLKIRSNHLVSVLDYGETVEGPSGNIAAISSCRTFVF